MTASETISINGATPSPVVLASDAKGQLAKLKTVVGWMTKRRLVGERLEDFQERVQKIVDALQVRSRVRVMLVRSSARSPLLLVWRSAHTAHARLLIPRKLGWHCCMVSCG